MSKEAQAPPENRLRSLPGLDASSPERMLKNFRYVVAAVNSDALRVWAELWSEFHHKVTPSGLVPPDMSQGFTPSCGWPEFLEKLWLLKHYLDYVHRLCQQS